MKYSLDDGVTWQNAENGVRVAYENLGLPGEDERGELLIEMTDERIIMDVWSPDVNVGSSSETVNEITLRLMEENS